jgi:hypothetical protein
MIDHRSLKSCAKAGLTCIAIKAMTIAIEVARMTASPTNNQNQWITQNCEDVFPRA